VLWEATSSEERGRLHSDLVWATATLTTVRRVELSKIVLLVNAPPQLITEIATKMRRRPDSKRKSQDPSIRMPMITLRHMKHPNNALVMLVDESSHPLDVILVVVVVNTPRSTTNGTEERRGENGGAEERDS